MSQFWLVKSEPDEFSLQDLQQLGEQGESWQGVRNFQARNYLRQMQIGDEVLFYHSSCKPAQVVGVAKVVREVYIDQSAFDASSPYFDAKSDRQQPKWQTVDLAFVKQFKKPVTLAQIKQQRLLADMMLIKQPRLSVMPISQQHWQSILAMSGDDKY